MWLLWYIKMYETWYVMNEHRSHNTLQHKQSSLVHLSNIDKKLWYYVLCPGDSPMLCITYFVYLKTRGLFVCARVSAARTIFFQICKWHAAICQCTPNVWSVRLLAFFGLNGFSKDQLLFLFFHKMGQKTNILYPQRPVTMFLPFFSPMK